MSNSNVRSTLKGVKELTKKLREVTRDLEKQQMKALKIEGERIMTDSKQNYVPVDKGTLRSSGIVSDPVKEGDTISISLGYGGAAAAYATALHEYPSDANPPTWNGQPLTFSKPGTGPKFLELPLMKAVDGMTERLAEHIKLKE
jgi:hypothetical protein